MGSNASIAYTQLYGLIAGATMLLVALTSLFIHWVTHRFARPPKTAEGETVSMVILHSTGVYVNMLFCMLGLYMLLHRLDLFTIIRASILH